MQDLRLEVEVTSNDEGMSSVVAVMQHLLK
jgi:hypothetical protein